MPARVIEVKLTAVVAVVSCLAAAVPAAVTITYALSTSQNRIESLERFRVAYEAEATAQSDLLARNDEKLRALVENDRKTTTILEDVRARLSALERGYR